MSTAAPAERIPITVIHRHYPQNSHLAWLVGNGPKFFKNIFYKPGEEEDMKWPREPYQSEHEKCIVLMGHHPKLVEQVQKAHNDYQTSVQERDRAKEKALWEFQDQWAKDNPYPTYPDSTTMVESRGLATILPSTSMAKVKQTSFLRK